MPASARFILLSLILLVLSGCSSLARGPVTQTSAAKQQPDERFRDVSRLVEAGPPADTRQLNRHYRQQHRAWSEQTRYACHYPVYAGYFARRFATPADFSACSATVPFYLFNPRNGGELRWLKPGSMSSIHLLFSSQGEALQSSFGHIALRLIVCPDTDAQAGVHCDRNLQQHMVLGFMGRIDELKMNPLKGVFGGYDAHLMAFDFMEIYRTNTLYDNRNMISLPLRLEADEIEQIVRELAEVHWRYRGDYRFFTNNCATLLQDTLSQLIADYDGNAALKDGFIRPDSFFRAIKNSPLADSSVLQDLQQAERDGYYFSSNIPYYRQALKLVNQHRSLSPATSLDAYLRAPATQRLVAIVKDPQLLQTIKSDDYIRDAQLLLEEYVLLKRERQLNDAITRYLASSDIDAVFRRARASLQQQQKTDTIDFLQRCYLLPMQHMLARLPRADGMPDDAFLKDFVPAQRCTDPGMREEIRQTFNQLMPADNPLRQESSRLAREISLTMKNITTLQ